MIVLDANILLYAYDGSSEFHEPVREWLEARFRAREAIGLPWVSLWAFLRIATNARVMRTPLPVKEAFSVLEEIRRMPRAVVLAPGTQHAEILERLTVGAHAGGSRLTDAVLAAIAVEHGAKLASTDRDFARFKELKWVNPI